MPIQKAIIWIDGASKGNPGPAAIGAVIRDEQGKLHSILSERIGETTNNRAEYTALISALRKALSLGVSYADQKVSQQGTDPSSARAGSFYTIGIGLVWYPLGRTRLARGI